MPTTGEPSLPIIPFLLQGGSK